MNKTDLLKFFDDNGIAYSLHLHPAVYTNEQAEVWTKDLPGFHAKNLFLSNEKGEKFYLFVTDGKKKTNLKEMRKQIKESPLRFASAEDMERYLGVSPGSVSPLAIINDAFQSVQLLFSKEAWEAPCMLCHPLENTATMVISHEGLEKFFSLTNHAIVIIDQDSVSKMP